ncbi:MAG: hypothetical protein Q9160_006553 [Pyrenula sp. 1 TL-2023]
MEVENPFQAAQTIDPEVRAYVYSLVNALGGAGCDEYGRYVLGDDALACLRDLKRWLKLYDEKTNRLDVARCLAEANLVNGDLLPILASWSQSQRNDKPRARIALACLEVLVPLTWPLENDQMTVNHHRHTPYIQQAQTLYKAGVLGHDTTSILRTAVQIGLPAIAIPRSERSTRDEGIIKLMLYFLRNIAMISQHPGLPSQGLETEISRSATIEAFKYQDVFALLLTLSSNMGEDFDQQDVIILDILFHLVRGIEVRKLFMNESQRKTHKTSELKDVLRQESGMHRDYKKTAPTRHGRFGTMIWVKRDEEKVSTVSGQDNLKNGAHTLAKMDKSKKFDKPRMKKSHEQHSNQDFDRSIALTDSAVECLRIFVEEFLDSGFNPLFMHLRKAIEREAERVLSANYRQYFYVVAWFLEAERARRASRTPPRQQGKLRTDFEADSYGLVAGVLNQEMFISLNRYMQNAIDHKDWQDLNASIRCFTQILLTIQEMASSPIEEDQEIADNIQNRIFYEETTHDRILSILRDSQDKGFGHLDASTELAHVFLRMLERYAKENVDLQIRSRKRARQKRKEKEKPQDQDQDQDETGADEESENEDAIDTAQVSRERKFDFNRFAAKFTNQKSVDAFIAFTKYYRDLSVEQLKRAHRFFYRVAFKQELVVLLFRVDIIALFRRMVKGPDGLHKQNAMFREWEELARQVMRRLFKKLDQRPELLVEMLFSKINATLFFLEYGYEKQTSSTSKHSIELEVSSRVKPLAERLGVVIGALQEDDMMGPVHMLRRNLQTAVEERKSWEDEVEARNEDNPSTEDATEPQNTIEQPLPPPITLRPRNDEDLKAMSKKPKVRLLLTLCSFEQSSPRSASAPHLPPPWIIPSSLTSNHLGELLSIIESNILKPLTEFDGEDLATLLRRTRFTREDYFNNEDVADGEAPRANFINDNTSDSDEGSETFAFPDNLRRPNSPSFKNREKPKKRTLKRKRPASNADDDANADNAAALKRKAREEAALERRRKIKSELYIRESDEETDEDADAEFFRMEGKRRRKQEGDVIKAMMVGREVASKQNAPKKKRDSNDEGILDLSIDTEDEADKAEAEDENESEDGGAASPKKKRKTHSSSSKASSRNNNRKRKFAPRALSDSSASASDDDDLAMNLELDIAKNATGSTTTAPRTRPTPMPSSSSPTARRDSATPSTIDADADVDADDTPITSPAPAPASDTDFDIDGNDDDKVTGVPRKLPITALTTALTDGDVGGGGKGARLEAITATAAAKDASLSRGAGAGAGRRNRNRRAGFIVDSDDDDE